MCQVNIGEVYLHADYYQNPDGNNEKFLVILASCPAGDYIYKLLTSRENGRPRNPACYHGDPYPSYFLDTLGGIMRRESWVDLRAADDYDSYHFRSRVDDGIITLIGQIPHDELLALLECVAGSDDVTLRQERSIRDALAEQR